MRWFPGSMVVFEGLDRAGKSTQLEMLLKLPWNPAPAQAHMPSGIANCTDDIYQVTEARKSDDPLAVQLLHLSAHLINMQQLLQLRERRGLLMDRCGWSALAYGGLGQGMESVGVPAATFVSLVNGVWSRMVPDVVFLFDQPFDTDSANTPIVVESYRRLAHLAGEACVTVALGSPAEVHEQVLSELRARGIIEL
jgi:thymidylate kinase